MNIKWVSKNFESGTLTIYDNNLTFNQSATNYLDQAYKVMLGLDYKKRMLIVKPVSKDEVLLGAIDDHLLYKISIGTSYSRVTNKKFVNELVALLGLDFESEKSYKYSIEWDDAEKVLISTLDGGE